MNDLIKLGKKVFTYTVVLSTIAWSIGLGALALPLAASAAVVTPGDLLKGSGTAVYYYGTDEQRYVFPYSASYDTWFADFDDVQTLSDAELIAIPFGGNVTARPARLAQVVSMDSPWSVMDPKVYAVEQGGVLRWVQTAEVATEIFGADWESQIVAVPESLLTNYTIGSEVDEADDYDLSAQQAVESINEDKGLVEGGTGEAGTLSVALASDTPASASIPKSAADVYFTSLDFTAGAEDVSITQLKVTRSGLGIDSNLSSIKVYIDDVQRGTSQTLGSTHMATFTLTTNPIEVAANSTVSVVLGADIAAATAYDQHVLGIASVDDITTTASVSGSFPLNGNTMSLADVTIGTLTVAGGTLNPGTAGGGDVGVDPAAEDFRFSQAKFTAGATEAVVLEQLTVIKNGTAANSDVSNIELYNDTAGVSIGTVDALGSDGKVTFDDLDIEIAKGGYAELSIKADLNGGSGRTLGFDIHDGTSFSGKVRGVTYGSGITPTVAAAFCDTGVTDYTCQRQTINQGYLTVSKSASAPARGNISQGASGVPLMAFDFVVAGEAINVSSTDILYTTTTATADQFTNWTLYTDELTLAGPKNGDDTDAGEEELTFSDAYTLPVGTTTVYVKADVSSATSADDYLHVHTAAGAITAKGANSGKTVYTTSSGSTVPPAAVITGNRQTVKGPAITAIIPATPVASTVVVNAQDEVLSYIDLDATSGGEDVRLSAVTVTATESASADATLTVADFNNFELWGDPDNTDDVEENIRLETSNSTVTMTDGGGATATLAFTLRTPIVVSKEAVSRLTLKADVLANSTSITAWDLAAGTAMTAVGVSSGATATRAVSGAGQGRTTADNGVLKVTQAADKPAIMQIASSTTGVELMKYKFTSQYEDIDVTELDLFCGDGDQDGTNCTLANVSKLYLYQDGELIGSTNGYTLDATGIATVVLPSGTFVVPKDDNAYLSIKADIPDKTQTTTVVADELQIGIQAASANGVTENEDNTWADTGADNDYWIVATGRSSGALISKDTINQLGSDDAANNIVYGSNLHTVHDGILTVSLNASSPSGTQTAGANSEVLRFNLTATGDDISVIELEFCTAGTATAITGDGDLTLKNEDLSVTYGTIDGTDEEDFDDYWDAVLGDSDYHILTPGVSGGSCFSWTTGTPGDVAETAMDAFDVDPVITAGTTQVFRLFGDTTGAASTKTLQVSIQANPNASYDTTVAGIDYEAVDGVNVDLSTTGGLPLSGGSLSY